MHRKSCSIAPSPLPNPFGGSPQPLRPSMMAVHAGHSSPHVHTFDSLKIYAYRSVWSCFTNHAQKFAQRFCVGGPVGFKVKYGVVVHTLPMERSWNVKISQIPHQISNVLLNTSRKCERDKRKAARAPQGMTSRQDFFLGHKVPLLCVVEGGNIHLFVCEKQANNTGMHVCGS